MNSHDGLNACECADELGLPGRWRKWRQICEPIHTGWSLGFIKSFQINLDLKKSEIST
jgi:hypothetical protein